MVDIAIADYGAGNLESVRKALDYLGYEAVVTGDPDSISGADRLVLPGVGAFGAAMNALAESGMDAAIKEWLQKGRPYLGICLGLQMLFSSSEESPEAEGLCVLKGRNVAFKQGKVPQIGWNQVNTSGEIPLFNGIPSGSYFYLLHSYHVEAADEGIVRGTTDYGVTYPTAVVSDNICAVQFHPEKSGDAGLQLLKNWIELC